MTIHPELDVAAIVRILAKHRVRYVVIGGVAATVHGAPIPDTLDMDITPERSKANEERLAAALADMEAKLRAPGLDEGFAIPLDGRTFKKMVTMTFVTKHGPLDVSFRPDGTEGYEDLARDSSTVKELGVEIPIASLRDIIRSKEAAKRSKDAEHLPILYRFLAEQGE